MTMQNTATGTGIVLSPGAAAKLQKMSSAFDQRRTKQGGQHVPTGPIENEIWGLLTECDASGQRYSFVRVIPDASGDDTDVILTANKLLGFNIVENPANLMWEAYEANGAVGCVLQVVRLSFAGFRTDPTAGKVPVFVFQYEPMNVNPVIPIHDHRDNTSGGAGFAFSVYHPGTPLPQQEWNV